MIPKLIDKQDNFEIVRDKVAAILKLEVVNQMALATAAGKDPDDWKLRIFVERSNPWEEFLNVEGETDLSPLVNIWFNNSGFNKKASNVMERQASLTTYNIDCYGYGATKNNPAGGHIPGDQEAAFEVQKAIRLVRNILMAGENTYLQLRGLVWSRWPRAITEFQPQIDNRALQNVIGARIALDVEFNELSPQVDDSNKIEILAIKITRLDSGEIVITANDGDLVTAGDGQSTAGGYSLGEGAEIDLQYP